MRISGRRVRVGIDSPAQMPRAHGPSATHGLDFVKVYIHPAVGTKALTFMGCEVQFYEVNLSQPTPSASLNSLE